LEICKPLAGGGGTPSAVSYYVDFAEGNDDNTGDTWTAAWKHCPGDDSATGNASGDTTPLTAGDTVAFKGGVEYNGRIDLTWSGTAGNTITFISGHLLNVQWGTERAIIDGAWGDDTVTLAGDNRGVMNAVDCSYLSFKGLEARDAPWTSYTGCFFLRRCDTVTFDNVYIHGNNKDTCWSGINIEGLWDEGEDTPSNYRIVNSEIFENAGHGIFLRYGLRYVLIENNKIHDCGPDYGGLYAGDGLFAWGHLGTGWVRDVTLRNNDMYDFPSKGFMYGLVQKI